MLVFEERGNFSVQSREPKKLNLHMTPSLGIEPVPHKTKSSCNFQLLPRDRGYSFDHLDLLPLTTLQNGTQLMVRSKSLVTKHFRFKTDNFKRVLGAHSLMILDAIYFF